MKTGKDPKPERLAKVALGMEKCILSLESMLDRMDSSNDFQTREYVLMAKAHIERSSGGESIREMLNMMKWQSMCMKAMACNQPPPLPPPGLNVMKMVKDHADGKSTQTKKKITSMSTIMNSARRITASPFAGTAGSDLASKEMAKEYADICTQHKDLIELGGRYAQFDSGGKMEFLDRIEDIEKRWEAFFEKFRSAGKLNPEYTTQCDEFLESLGMQEGEFRALLQKTHSIMRADATGGGEMEYEHNWYSFIQSNNNNNDKHSFY